MSKDTDYICMCEDSKGVPHNVPMTEEEYRRDIMCSVCADHVWNELFAGLPLDEEYIWEHKTARK